MTIQHENNGHEGAESLSNQPSSAICLPAENICKTSPYFRTILDIATSYNLIGPVATEHDGQTLVFDFYNPKDGSLYKVFTSDEFNQANFESKYTCYSWYPGNVRFVIDVNKCDLDTWPCPCCDHAMVQLPFTELGHLLDYDRTWVLSKGELCEYHRMSHCGYEVWHGVDADRER